MKGYLKKGVSLFLVVSVTALGLAGCGTEKKEDAVKASAPVESADLEALLDSKAAGGSAVDKAETVYVEMDADGEVTGTTVSDVLSTSGKENINRCSGSECWRFLANPRGITARSSQIRRVSQI